MKNAQPFTTPIYRENGGYVAVCLELDLASQGDSGDEVSANLREAVELFIETADLSEIERRTRDAKSAYAKTRRRPFG
jgi:predicted RNase H-like HicB family nuclease